MSRGRRWRRVGTSRRLAEFRHLSAQKMMVEDRPDGREFLLVRSGRISAVRGGRTTPATRSGPGHCGYCATRPRDRDEWRVAHLDCGFHASRRRIGGVWRVAHLNCGFCASRRPDRGVWRVTHVPAREITCGDARTAEHAGSSIIGELRPGSAQASRRSSRSARLGLRCSSRSVRLGLSRSPTPRSRASAEPTAWRARASGIAPSPISARMP